MLLLLTRRIVAAVLALLFTLQSAGSALAMGAQGVSVKSAPLSVQVASALQSLRTTHVGAILSGDGGRWAAMHAPPPVFKHEAPPQIVPPDRHVYDAPQFRTSVFRPGPHMLSLPLNVNEAPKDPRAMAHSAANPIGMPCMQVKTPCVTELIRTRGGIQTMSVTPTVQPFLFEADTASGPTTPIFVTAGIESGAISQTMDSAPPNASANQTLTYTPYSGSVSYGWVSPANVPSSTSWPAQTYSVTLNITQANPNIKIIVVKILRVDSTGGGGTGTDGLATVGSLTGLAQSLGTTGTLTFNVSGAAQTAGATDRIAVKIVVQNTATTTQSFSYLAGQNSGSGLNLANAGTVGTSTTGINPWWTYVRGTLPGHGKYMVNVGNGNLLVQASDVDIPERGVDLAFHRTFNSQSTHDSNNTDASVPSNYGDGWTSTFDAHLAYHGANTMSVYDVDGARYDYTGNGSGGWVAPAGQHGVLAWDGGCGYQWTKKNGTIYYFYSPDLNESPTCSEFNPTASYPQDSAYGGRLYKIWGRNSNNAITFGYRWNPDATNPSNLTEIDATHSDGHALVLKFGPAVSGGPTELQSLTRPDGKIINYHYDSTGAKLSWVYRPGNSTVTTLTESYGYNSGHQLHYATSPRYNFGSGDGDVTYFSYDGSNRVTQTYDWGLVNFVPNDGTSTALQLPAPASTPLQTWRTINFSGYGTGTTTMTDSDGHSTAWTVPTDSTFRVTQTQASTGEASPTYLVTSQKWDSNNVIQTTDASGYTTDYAYDANGNTTAIALPLTSTNQGTFRPTSLYSYDVHNNVTASCDPIETHALGKDWTVNPGSGDSLCPSQQGASRFTWSTADAYEPYGQLTDTYTPLGYHRQILYTTTAQGGDYGLRSEVKGDAITQFDGPRTPDVSFTYDSFGNEVSVSAGAGLGTTVYAYDTLNRRMKVTDPDGVSSYNCYYDDSQVQYTETASQHSLDGNPAACQTTAPTYAVSFAYDADGNLTSQVRHFGNIAGTTSKWYDGADRLVEVKLPQDSADVFQSAWITRYLYDLTQGGTVSITAMTSQTYKAYGNLFKTQELLVAGTSQQLSWSSGSAKLVNNTFQDIKGTAFDALDRGTAKYLFVGDAPQKESFTYDGGAYSGELTQHCNTLGVCGNLVYSVLNQTTQISYTDSTPTESMTYDADGRIVSVASSTFGTQTLAFDQDGRETTSAEPTAGGVTSPATLTHHYYADGLPSGLDVSSSALNQATLFAYSYRADGKLQQQQINLGSNAKVGSSALVFTYSNAGRLLQRSESGPAANGNAISYTYDINGGGNTGKMTAANFPAAALSAFSYDAENETLTYNQSVYGNSNGSIGSFAYTDRGELKCDPRPGCNIGMANGLVVSASSSNTEGWDARRAAVTGAGNTSFTYDNAGRQTNADQSGTDHYGNTIDTTDGLTYDAENRVISGSQYMPDAFNGGLPNGTYWTSLTAYDWGPNGHPIRIGSTPHVMKAAATTSQLAYDTLHWDGDHLLFTTNSQGQVDDIKIGSIGDITPLDPTFTGLTFWDRFSGSVAFCHNNTGAAGKNQQGAYHVGPPCTVASGQTMQIPSSLLWDGGAALAGGVGQGKILGMPGTDGVADGISVIQGVRAYDPAQGQWTTPDPNGGSAQNPISQKSYAWNNNNPLSYSDPSGLDPTMVPPVWLPPGTLPEVAPGSAICLCSPGNAADADWLKAAGVDVAASTLTTAATSRNWIATLGAALAGAGYGMLIEPFLGHSAPSDTLYVQSWYNSHGGTNVIIDYKPGSVAQALGYAPFDAFISTNWTGSETILVHASDGNHTYKFAPPGGSYVADMQADAMNGAYSDGQVSNLGGTPTMVGGYNNLTPW